MKASISRMLGFVAGSGFIRVWVSIRLRVWFASGSCPFRVWFVSGFVSGFVLCPVRIYFGSGFVLN